MSAETEVHPMNSDLLRSNYADYPEDQNEEDTLPKKNRLKKLSRKIEPENNEESNPALELKNSFEDSRSIFFHQNLTEANQKEEAISHSKKKKKKLDQLASEFRAELSNQVPSASEIEDKVNEIVSSGEIDVSQRKNKGKKKNQDLNEKNLEKLVKIKEKKERKKKTTVDTMSTLMQLDENVYTREEEDDNENSRERRFNEAMSILEKSEKIRDVGKKRKTGGAGTVKTRNKLFGEFNQADFLNDENENQIHEEEYVGEDIVIDKVEKKKDATHVFRTVERFKSEKVRVQPQKSQSSAMLERQPSMKDSSNSNKAEGLPQDQPTLTQGESVVSTELGTIPSIMKSKSIDFKTILSQSKMSLSIADADRLLEVEVAVPHITKQQSQSITENTLFLNHLTKTNTIVDKSSIKAASNSQTMNRQFKDLKSMAQELRNKIREKRSRDLTLDIIQSRFQATELDIVEGNKKKKSNSGNLKEEDDESDDSDFFPEGEAKGDGINIDLNAETDPIPVPSIFRDSQSKDEAPKSTSQEAKPQKVVPLSNDDIKKLEEGEESEEEAGEDDDEEEEEEGDDEEGESEVSEVEEEVVTGTSGPVESSKPNENSNSVYQIVKERPEPENNYLDQFGEMSIDFKERERMSQEQKSLGRLKRIGDKILETLKKREQEEAEAKRRKELRKQEKSKLKEKLNGYMELEAELGSDNEENDDIAKQIDKKDQAENEDGLDQDLAELIDYAYNDDGDPEGLRKYLEDLKHDDRENLKRVMQRNFANKKRKRADFEYNLGDEEERIRRKALRMEEAIKILEENDKARFSNEQKPTKAQEEEDDVFNDEAAVKRFQLSKATTQVRKNMEKKVPQKQIEKTLFQTDEEEVMSLMRAQVERKASQKMSESLRSTSNPEPRKPSGSIVRMGTMSKNSILNVKQSQNNISLFNNQFNKNVINEFGSKSGVMAALLRDDPVQNQAKGKSSQEGSLASSSLNKLFTPNSDFKAKATGGGQNPMHFFKTRTKKDN